MGSLVRFIVRSRAHAISVAVIGILVPPFSILTGAIVGLTILRYRLADGALVLAVSTVALGLVTGAFQPAVNFILFIGLPVFLLAQLLRQTESQGIALTAAGAMSALALSGIHLLMADPVAWWAAQFERSIGRPIRESNPDFTPEMLERFDEVMAVMSLPVATIASAMLTAMLTLWLARWMHASLDNPGGFGKEFRALRLDRRVAYVAVALSLLSVVAGQFAHGLFLGLLVLVINMYTIQGIALVHAVVHKRGASVAWLVAMYVAIVMLQPAATLGLALTGFSDARFDFRRRRGANV
ncbi:MAG: DUF2232 domain-containing protein [Proteobacteria bacterium]|nr:DUF2232 domain-containing protein [Pseudomonadota bacterium]